MKLNINNNQIIRAGIIFANMLGINVKDEELINNGDILAYPLYSGDRIIGRLSIKNNKVYILAKNEDFEVRANYDVPSAQGMADPESGIAGIVCAMWNNDIDCSIKTKNGLSITGEINFSCSADKEFGVNCSTHSNLDVTNSRLGNFNFRFNNNGETFYYCNQTDQTKETIEIEFFQDRICHIICSDFDENGEWNTRSLDGTIIQQHKEIRSYNRIQKTDKNGYIYDSEYTQDITPLVCDYDNDIKTLIQLGNETQRVAPKMYERIKQIRQCLKINDTYLFDYLVNAMFKECELTKSTFGYIPQNINFQNGETNLRYAYFANFNQPNNLLGN